MKKSDVTGDKIRGGKLTIKIPECLKLRYSVYFILIFKKINISLYC